MRGKRIVWGLVLGFLVSACGSREAETILSDIDTFIQDRPDSALTVLGAMDTLSLKTAKVRAHYALLHAMALDKNWIDTTDVNVVMPAVDYYARHGTADQKMKANYYLARIFENGGDRRSAIISYLRAEESSDGSHDDRFKGLLDFGFANTYQRSHYIDTAIAYACRGRDHFLNCADSVHYYMAQGQLAMLYQEKRMWEEADSLYRISIAGLRRETVAVKKYLSQYAAMKVIQPQKDPAGALALLNCRAGEYGQPFSMKDYGVYAYASALTGDDKTCDSILAMIERQTDARRKGSRYFEYLIKEYRGEDAKALELLKKTYSDQDTLVAEILGSSIVQTVQDYYSYRAIDSEQRLQQRRHRWTVAFLLLLISGGAFVFWLIRRQERERKVVDSLIRTAEETNKMLQRSNTVLQADVERLQGSFVGFYQQQLERMGSICEAYLLSKEDYGRKSLERVYERVEEIVRSINNDEEGYRRFESQVNGYLDHVVEHLKEDLSRKRPLSPRTVRFLCYTAAGFDTKTISVLLDMSLSTIYARRTRLRERIKEMDSPYKEQYLKYLHI